MNIWSEGMGSWSYPIILPMLARTFPNTTITTDLSKPPDLVIKSHFDEPRSYTCPYITWSGESKHVSHKEYPPILEVNTFLSERSNSLYFPLICLVHQKICRPTPNREKQWCCSFAYKNM